MSHNITWWGGDSVCCVLRESLRVSLLVADLKPNVEMSGVGFERAVLRPSLFVRVMNAVVLPWPGQWDPGQPEWAPHTHCECAGKWVRARLRLMDGGGGGGVRSGSHRQDKAPSNTRMAQILIICGRLMGKWVTGCVFTSDFLGNFEFCLTGCSVGCSSGTW